MIQIWRIFLTLLEKFFIFFLFSCFFFTFFSFFFHSIQNIFLFLKKLIFFFFFLKTFSQNFFLNKISNLCIFHHHGGEEINLRTQIQSCIVSFCFFYVFCEICVSFCLCLNNKKLYLPFFLARTDSLLSDRCLRLFFFFLSLDRERERPLLYSFE